MFGKAEIGGAIMSLPARGAWIEIAVHVRLRQLREVAPRKGSVD